MKTAPETETPPCVLCGNPDAVLLFEGRDQLHNLPGVFGVSQCMQCGAVYTRPRPKDIAAFYPAAYQPHLIRERHRKRTFQRLMLAGFAGYPGPRWAARILLWPIWPFWRAGARYARVIPWTGRMRLFDFGCGAGNYLAWVRSLGATVAGMDMSEQAVAACREKGLDVQQGTLPCPDIPDRSYDAVVMWQSLEHVANPRAVVADAYRILAPGGRVAIGVPLFDSIPRKRFGADWYFLDVPRHLTHFDSTSLRRLLAEEGFDRVSVRRRRSLRGWVQSFRRRYERTGSRFANMLSRNKSLCKLLGMVVWTIRAGDLGVAHARKPLD